MYRLATAKNLIVLVPILLFSSVFSACNNIDASIKSDVKVSSCESQLYSAANNYFNMEYILELYQIENIIAVTDDLQSANTDYDYLLGYLEFMRTNGTAYGRLKMNVSRDVIRNIMPEALEVAFQNYSDSLLFF